MINIMDPIFNGMGGSEMYRGQLFPELFPHQREMMLENWSLDDLEMYVGGKFTPGYQFIHHQQRHLLGVN